jgi:hypothetical protein
VGVGGASAAKENRMMKCIVKGCSNRVGEGAFVGPLCRPCHTALTTGNLEHTAVERLANPASMSEEQQNGEILEFQTWMMRKLQQNMRKGGWHRSSALEMLERTQQEMDEVQMELAARNSPKFSLEKLYAECADVANCIGMVASCVKMSILEARNARPFPERGFDPAAVIPSVEIAVALAGGAEGGGILSDLVSAGDS